MVKNINKLAPEADSGDTPSGFKILCPYGRIGSTPIEAISLFDLPRTAQGAALNPPSVYIDHLMTCLVSAAWRWPKSCHMFVAKGTDLEVLHAFAKRIGLKREWFQDKSVPHYDLNPSRRIKAVSAGAVELDRRAAVQIFRDWKSSPSNAPSRIREGES